MKWFSMGLLALMVSTQPATAAMQSYVTAAGSTVDGRVVSAKVDFTTNNNGTITVTLTNLLTNSQLAPNGWYDVQLVGGVKFQVSGAIGTTASTAGSGAIADIDSTDGSYSVLNAADPLTRWTSTVAGSTIDLSMFSGGKPNRQIIGTDSLGKLDGSGVYWPVAGNVADNFAPVVLGSATFTLTVSGVTAATTLSDIQFRFSTNQSTFVPGQVNGGGTQGGVVPEPTSLALAGFAGIGFALQALRRRRSQRSDQAA